MIIPMNSEIQGFIITVQDYRNWRRSHKFLEKKTMNERAKEVEEESYLYFKQMNPRKFGLGDNKHCYDMVIHYPINDTVNTEANELAEHFNFAW